MKAVLQAGWLLTVAVGNFIVLIVAEIAKLPKKVKLEQREASKMLAELSVTRSVSPSILKWAEFFLFASLLVAVCVIFSIMAYFYTYIDPTEIEAQFTEKKEEKDEEEEKDEMKKIEVQMMKRDSIKSNDSDDGFKQSKMWKAEPHHPKSENI